MNYKCASSSDSQMALYTLRGPHAALFSFEIPNHFYLLFKIGTWIWTSATLSNITHTQVASKSQRSCKVQPESLIQALADGTRLEMGGGKEAGCPEDRGPCDCV